MPTHWKMLSVTILFRCWKKIPVTSRNVQSKPECRAQGLHKLLKKHGVNASDFRP